MFLIGLNSLVQYIYSLHKKVTNLRKKIKYFIYEINQFQNYMTNVKIRSIIYSFVSNLSRSLDFFRESRPLDAKVIVKIFFMKIAMLEKIQWVSFHY